MNFEEVNLRFYVRRRESGEVRRGVVFVKEIVPRRAIAYVARWSYGEKYFAYPTRHTISEWVHLQRKFRDKWHAVGGVASGAASLLREGCLEQFATEHYWGYSTKREGGSVEYRLSHVPWWAWTVSETRFEGDGDLFYGDEFGECLNRAPDSAFIAEGLRSRSTSRGDYLCSPPSVVPFRRIQPFLYVATFATDAGLLSVLWMWQVQGSCRWDFRGVFPSILDRKRNF